MALILLKPIRTASCGSACTRATKRRSAGPWPTRPSTASTLLLRPHRAALPFDAVLARLTPPNVACRTEGGRAPAYCGALPNQRQEHAMTKPTQDPREQLQRDQQQAQQEANNNRQRAENAEVA
ncbi:hypothetical protein LP420_07325 [Massilia sp. B-10]|nr:hypothetical protein LP420_07325 [Massilia sp. B-10]